MRLLRGIKLCRGQLMALTGNNSTKYIGRLCSDYLGTKEENIATLEEALSSIVKIYDNANQDLQKIYMESGASPIFHEGEKLVDKLADIKQQMEDVVMNAIVGHVEFRRLHSQKLLLYQTL